MNEFLEFSSHAKASITSAVKNCIIKNDDWDKFKKDVLHNIYIETNMGMYYIEDALVHISKENTNIMDKNEVIFCLVNEKSSDKKININYWDFFSFDGGGIYRKISKNIKLEEISLKERLLIERQNRSSELIGNLVFSPMYGFGQINDLDYTLEEGYGFRAIFELYRANRYEALGYSSDLIFFRNKATDIVYL